MKQKNKKKISAVLWHSSSNFMSDTAIWKMGKSFFSYSVLLHLRIPSLLGCLCTSHPWTDLPWKGFPYNALTGSWAELSPSQQTQAPVQRRPRNYPRKNILLQQDTKKHWSVRWWEQQKQCINPFSPEHHKQVKGAGKSMVFTSERSNTWLFIGWSQICSALIARQFKSYGKNAVKRRKKTRERGVKKKNKKVYLRKTTVHEKSISNQHNDIVKDRDNKWQSSPAQKEAFNQLCSVVPCLKWMRLLHPSIQVTEACLWMSTGSSGFFNFI